MERKIKFRGMDANGVMRYGRLSQDKPHSTAYYDEYSQRICWDDSNIPVRNDTLGQFTGLKDKSGKEIYEGDILQRYDILGNESNVLTVVYFDTDLAQFAEKYVDGTELGGSAGYVRIEGENSRVIGNIYENSNLLNK